MLEFCKLCQDRLSSLAFIPFVLKAENKSVRCSVYRSGLLSRGRDDIYITKIRFGIWELCGVLNGRLGEFCESFFRNLRRWGIWVFGLNEFEWN